MPRSRESDVRDLAARVERLEGWFVSALLSLVGMLVSSLVAVIGVLLLR